MNDILANFNEMWDYKTHAPKKFNGAVRKNDKQKSKWCKKD